MRYFILIVVFFGLGWVACDYIKNADHQSYDKIERMFQ